MERTKVLLGSYANARPHDPKTYTAAVAVVLSDYPAAVVVKLTDPREPGCIQRRSKWLPEVCEVVDACEAAMPGWRASQAQPPSPEQIQAMRDDRARFEREQREREERERPKVLEAIEKWRAEVGPMDKRKGWDIGARRIGNLIPHIVGAEQEHHHAESRRRDDD
jgi:hypothetical protein